MKFEGWYNQNYKKLLLIPGIFLTICIIYLSLFNIQNGSLFHKDISLTGGTTYTILTERSLEELNTFLNLQTINFESKALQNNLGEQTALKITVGPEEGDSLETILEEFLGEKLTEENSSVEKTTTSLSEEFYNQLVIAILLAFFWMAGVVFLIFYKGAKIKTGVIILNIF